MSDAYYFTLSDSEPYVYPQYACPKWETTKTIFTSEADMDRLGWGKAKSEDDIEDSSEKGNPPNPLSLPG